MAYALFLRFCSGGGLADDEDDEEELGGVELKDGVDVFVTLGGARDLRGGGRVSTYFFSSGSGKESKKSCHVGNFRGGPGGGVYRV